MQRSARAAALPDEGEQPDDEDGLGDAHGDLEPAGVGVGKGDEHERACRGDHRDDAHDGRLVGVRALDDLDHELLVPLDEAADLHLEGHGEREELLLGGELPAALPRGDALLAYAGPLGQLGLRPAASLAQLGERGPKLRVCSCRRRSRWRHSRAKIWRKQGELFR